MIKPLPGYVLIEPNSEDEEKTSSGLIMPEKAKEKPAKGRIIEIGIMGTTFSEALTRSTSLNDINFLAIPFHIREDQVVIFHRWSGQDIKYGEKEYKLVKFSDLMGVYE